MTDALTVKSLIQLQTLAAHLLSIAIQIPVGMSLTMVAASLVPIFVVIIIPAISIPLTPLTAVALGFNALPAQLAPVEIVPLAKELVPFALPSVDVV